MTRKLLLGKILLSLTKNGKEVVRYRPRYRTRLLARLYRLQGDRIDFDTAYLLVNYKDDYHNDGTYTNWKDLRQAAFTFLEPNYIKEVLAW